MSSPVSKPKRKNLPRRKSEPRPARKREPKPARKREPKPAPKSEPQLSEESEPQLSAESEPQSTWDRLASDRPQQLLAQVIKRHPQLGPGGYIWILNVAEVENDCVDLAPGCQLRRANDDEINDIRMLFELYQARMEPRNPWEVAANVNQGDTPGAKNISWTALPSDRFRYHLLEYKHPSNIAAHRLCDASVLAKGFYFDQGYSVFRAGNLGGGSFIPSGAGSSRTLDRVLYQLRFSDDTYFGSFSSTDAEDLVSTFIRLEDARTAGKAEEVERGCAAFRAIMEVTHNEMRLLGLFTIIESLLTHKPEANDPHQSLIRQIYSKMELLGNRFARPLDYATHLGSKPNIDTVWKKLYDLRSVIAHGSRPDFNSKNLSLLKNRETAEAIVQSAARSLLRQLLCEPQLMHDLKEC